MVQITLVSPLTRTGAPIPTAPRVGAAAITAAKRRKHRRYPELAPNRGGGQRLLVLACEIGGRWRSDCQHLLRLLLRHRARRTAAAGVPRPAVAGSADGGGYSVSPSSKRWPALRRATCGSIRNSPLAGPPLPDILDLAPSAGPSRLPLRCSFTPTARMEKGAGEKKKYNWNLALSVTFREQKHGCN